jgi:hypothetical protein
MLPSAQAVPKRGHVRFEQQSLMLVQDAPEPPQFATHCPLVLQVSPLEQVPHEVPHTGSAPQTRPVQFGVQPVTHWTQDDPHAATAALAVA